MQLQLVLRDSPPVDMGCERKRILAMQQPLAIHHWQVIAGAVPRHMRGSLFEHFTEVGYEPRIIDNVLSREISDGWTVDFLLAKPLVADAEDVAKICIQIRGLNIPHEDTRFIQSVIAVLSRSKRALKCGSYGPFEPQDFGLVRGLRGCYVRGASGVKFATT